MSLVYSLDKQSRGSLRKRPVDSSNKAAWAFHCTTELVKVLSACC